MSQIGVLITGAGIDTTFSGQAQAEMYMVIGDVDTTMPLTGFTVEIDGLPTINIQGSTPLISAFSKLLMQMTGSGVVGLRLPIGTGRINKNTTYRLTNGGVTTPALFVYSDQGAGAPILASTKGINPLSNDSFERFSSLLITDPANMTNAEVVFADGLTQTMTAIELDSLFASKWPTQANGRLDAAVTTVYNGDQSIQRIKINTGATGVTVATIKLPDDYFQRMKARAAGM